MGMRKKIRETMVVPHVLSLFYSLLASLTLAVLAGMYWLFKVTVLYMLAGSVYVLYSLFTTTGFALAWGLKSALLFISFVLHSIASCALSFCLSIFQVKDTMYILIGSLSTVLENELEKV